MNDKFVKQIKKWKPGNIQSSLMIAFSLISVSIVVCMGVIMYIRFSSVSRQEIVDSTQKLMDQTKDSMDEYLVNMRQISDAAYYNVIKESDLDADAVKIKEQMQLLYEVNKDKLRSIAIYDREGALMAAEPVATQKQEVNVTDQQWFVEAVGEMENIHFSTPHIQNLFDDGTMRYYWVISSSRVVDLTCGADAQLGVLLVDMDYSAISRMIKQINTLGSEQYFYLCDSNGEIIYHPKQVQISKGIASENNLEAAKHKDGVYEEYLGGKHRKIIVSTIGYTGWKLVGVVPYSIFTHKMIDMRQFSTVLILLMIMMLVIVNRIIALRISRPILRLDHSVAEYETGWESEIYIGGSLEIRHLGESIRKSYQQNALLMKEIVWEQNEKRKRELEALQSQINPHFLYNTLESITWMVEGGKNKEASFMISQLAKLFRISLSEGHTVIRLRDELQHARSYMNIQKTCYKNKFSVTFDVEESVYDYCVVKLSLQPLLENAINYGVREMEDCGEITVSGKQEADLLILSVTDNGLGIPPDEIKDLLTDTGRVHKKGSGVGLVNVNNRIQILFGKAYGLSIESELDEGTTVSIRIPAIPFSQEEQRVIENGSPTETALQSRKVGQ